MKSKEEIIASKLDDLLADSRLEPYLIGRYFAQMARLDVYDNFEQLVLSARHEKENRIEWLKKAVLGDKTMTSFENKCKILAQLWKDYAGDEDWNDFFEYNDMGLPLAFAISEKYILGTTDSGREMIEQTFASFLENIYQDDTGFTDLSELL